MQIQGCGTDTSRGFGTSGCSVVTLGRELTWDIAVDLEKREGQTSGLIWYPVVVQEL